MKLTAIGTEKVNAYINELVAKRKEIIDAGLDTADETALPDADAILDDIESFEENGEYWNCWGVTDNYDSDGPINLVRGDDYTD